MPFAALENVRVFIKQLFSAVINGGKIEAEQGFAIGLTF